MEKGKGGNKLADQTRFDCERHVWLPFTDEWLMPPSGLVVCVASYGSAPAARKEAIRGAVEAGKAKAKTSVAPIVSVKKTPKLSSSAFSLESRSLARAKPERADQSAMGVK